jgi:small ligand-binding sensory domain FIST
VTNFAAALSEHPLATQATGEVAGAVLEALGDGPPPDLAVLFTTAAHTGVVDDIARTIRGVLHPRSMIGATASSILAGPREVEETPALALWAARLAAPALPVRLDAHETPSGWLLGGLPEGAGTTYPTLVLLADPFTFPTDAFVESTASQYPGLSIVGGMASAARGPGGNRLILDGAVEDDGAVGVLLPRGAVVSSVVSQGCRPIGDPMIVTRAERNIVYELAGQPALDRLVGLLESLGPDERQLAQQGLHLGMVIDEHKIEFGPGDFLVRNVLGADRDAGAIAVGDEVEVGTTVQFQVRDADSADGDLRALMHGRRAGGALVFTCNGRGTHLFGRPDHDAAIVDDVVHGAAAGMFCAGEIGPVGGRSFLHGFTASVVLFGEVGGRPGG